MSVISRILWGRVFQALDLAYEEKQHCLNFNRVASGLWQEYYLI